MTMSAAPPSLPVTRGSMQSASVESVGLRVTHARFPSLRSRRHIHERNVCTVLLEGRWEEELGARTRAWTPPTTVTKPAGAEHVDRFLGERARVVLIETDATARELLAPCGRLFAQPRGVQSHGLAALAWRIAGELETRDPLRHVVVEGLALELLGMAGRSALERRGPLPAWLAQARDYIHAEFRRAPRVADIAAALNVHRVQLARSFRAYWGVSPGEYMRAVRLDWASAQVLTTDRPLADIAASAGFADQSHFTRAFRGRMGVTPGRYRAAAHDRRRTTR